MIDHIPDKLLPLVVDIPPSGMYETEVATYIQPAKPQSPEIAQRAFELCQLAILRDSKRIENAVPAHVGGKEQHDVLVALAKRCGVSLTYLKSNGEYGIIGEV